jgi:hypothetical protein
MQKIFHAIVPSVGEGDTSFTLKGALFYKNLDFTN